MSRRFILYPYKVASESAHRLKDAFIDAGHKALIVYPNRSYVCKEGDVVIGWGCSKQPNWHHTLGKASKVLNLWANIENSIDKKKAFVLFEQGGVRVPERTTKEITVGVWLGQGSTVVGRHSVRGMKAKGIEIIKNPADFQECKLYTKFIPNTKEFRVYVFQDKIIDVLEKRKENGSNDPGYVRSEENGWVFCRQHVTLPIDCGIQARKACKAVGLHFAGVDVLYSKDDHKAYVLETNTCPDIFGTGVKVFRDAFLNL